MFAFPDGIGCDGSHKTRLFRGHGHSLEALAEAIVFLFDLFRQAIAEFLEESSHFGMLLGPIGWIDAQ